MRFTGSCVQFEFDPVESHVSPRQVTLLLEGLGYDQVTCVTDDAGMVHVVAIWCFGKAPKDRSHEITALWGVLGKRITVAYYQLNPRQTDSSRLLPAPPESPSLPFRAADPAMY